MDASARLALQNLAFTVLVPGTVAGVVPAVLASGHQPAGGARAVLAALVFALGLAIYAWCVWDFASFGRGTPAPVKAPERLVVRGLYRASRNPMYVGVVTVIAGWAIHFGTLALALYAALVALAFHLCVVLYEEPHLRRVFGAEYERYCERVGRWLPWPR